MTIPTQSGIEIADAIAALPPLRETIDAYGLMARRSLGQNFLLDLNLTGRIARAAGDIEGHDVVEIGPGPGGLTRALLSRNPRRLVAIERDDRCIAALSELHDIAGERFQIIAADALDIHVRDIARPPLKIVANLPYNIATALVIRWLMDPASFISATILVQKEVAERMAAKPGGKTYGRLSVLVQWLCEVQTHFDISPRAFTPAPKVTSSLITLVPRRIPLAPARMIDIETVTAAAFGQRRKMLRSSLRTLWPDAEARLEQLGITPTRRAEELRIEDFCALARMLEESRLPEPEND